MNSTYAALGTTVFEVMSRLSAERGALNLGQGFPEDDGPRDILEAAARAYSDKCRQLIAAPPEDWRGVWIITTK